MNGVLGAMKQQSYSWTMQGNFAIRLRSADEAVELSFQLMNHEGLIVFAVRVLKGRTLIVFDSLASLFLLRTSNQSKQQ